MSQQQLDTDEGLYMMPGLVVGSFAKCGVLYAAQMELIWSIVICECFLPAIFDHPEYFIMQDIGSF